MAKLASGKWTKEQMKEFVLNNDKVLYGALLALYDCQTVDEQSVGYTQDHNNMGFNAIDSDFLSSVAESLKKYGRLTDKQKLVTRKKLVKYMGQITNLANAKYAAKQLV
jgi:hypothetical protein